jgi:hydroxyacylglutathione hydrolase
MPPTPVAIQTISLPLVNSYLVRGERWLLVDSGAPGDEHRILRAAAAHGVQPGDIGLILLTHGHVDHFGGAAALRALTGAPVAVHHADAGILRSGRNPDLAALGWEGRLFRPFLPWSAPPLEPDIVFDDDFTLHAYGLDATILATPGHSPGSITLLLPDRTMIVGDLLRGGYLGGRLLPQRPLLPFYAEDERQIVASLRRVLALDPSLLYVGHGGPLDPVAVRNRFPS